VANAIVNRKLAAMIQNPVRCLAPECGLDDEGMEMVWELVMGQLSSRRAIASNEGCRTRDRSIR
jgi:hypothetical protein